MKKLIIGVIVLAVLGLMFRGQTEDPKYTKNDLSTNQIFSESLDHSKKHSYKNEALYKLLYNDVRGLNNLRTQDYLIMFKFGKEEIHFIPINNGQSDSSKRKKYKITFGGPIETALAFGLESESGEKSVLSIESELHKKGCYVIKHVLEDESKSYCKRGILEAI